MKRLITKAYGYIEKKSSFKELALTTTQTPANTVI